MPNRFFSPSSRIQKIFLSGGLIVLLCVYASQKGPEVYPRIKEFTEKGDEFDGRRIALAYHKVIMVPTKDRFVIRDVSGRSIEVWGDSTLVKLGSIVTLCGVYRKAGFILLEDIYIHKGWVAKIILSIISLSIVSTMFLLRYRFSFRKFQFSRRP
jgi:hypothetical protein